MKDEFEIEEYNLSWIELYEKERSALGNIIGKNTNSIHHIGSTAIPNTMSKPEIDILIVVKDILDLPRIDNEIVRLGYVVRGQCLENGGTVGRFYYSKDVNNKRTHKLHICQIGHPEILDKLLFVKYLNDHKEVAEEYSQLKLELSRKYNYNKFFPEYLKGKSNFIIDVLVKSKMENSNLSYNDFI